VTVSFQAETQVNLGKREPSPPPTSPLWIPLIIRPFSNSNVAKGRKRRREIKKRKEKEKRKREKKKKGKGKKNQKDPSS
jgi:hypothetical protein